MNGGGAAGESSVMMSTSDLVLNLTRLGVGALATLLAILLWSNTRDSAWMLIITGTIIRYGQVLYDTFRFFGVMPTAHGTFIGLPAGAIVRLVLDNLPTALYAVGFIVVLARSRLR